MKNGTLSDDGEGNGAGSHLLRPAEFMHNNSIRVNNGNITVNASSVAPVARNCTARIRTYCNRETFRFWPGNVSQSHSSQGVMALVVMLIVLCLLIMYCCWGGCCKLIRRRRRISRSLNSAGSCSSYPNVVVLPYRGGIYDLQDPSSRRNGVNRPRSAKDSHGRMNPLPPPPYETLFGNESCNPPSYSSVCLPALDALHPPALSQAVVNQAPAPCDHLSGEVAAESSISQAPVGGSDPTPACVVAVDIERSIATNDLHNVDHSRGSLPEATARIPRCLSVPSSIGGSPHLVSAPSTVNLEV